MVWATDAKEVGVGNPAEETYRCPNLDNIKKGGGIVKWLFRSWLRQAAIFHLKRRGIPKKSKGNNPKQAQNGSAP